MTRPLQTDAVIPITSLRYELKGCVCSKSIHTWLTTKYHNDDNVCWSLTWPSWKKYFCRWITKIAFRNERIFYWCVHILNCQIIPKTNMFVKKNAEMFLFMKITIILFVDSNLWLINNVKNILFNCSTTHFRLARRSMASNLVNILCVFLFCSNTSRLIFLF